jgi:hypothetical protein
VIVYGELLMSALRQFRHFRNARATSASPPTTDIEAGIADVGVVPSVIIKRIQKSSKAHSREEAFFLLSFVIDLNGFCQERFGNPIYLFREIPSALRELREWRCKLRNWRRCLGADHCIEPLDQHPALFCYESALIRSLN